MAVDLTLKSIAITNREAKPSVFNNPGAGGVARVKEVFSLLASVPASLSATSIIRLVEVPSNAKITSVKLHNGAQTAGAGDIGVYKNNADGGTVEDADLFGSAVSLAAAVLGVEQMQESTQYTVADMEKPLWDVLGKTSDPKTTYDIAVTITTDITTGLGALGLRVQYVQ